MWAIVCSLYHMFSHMIYCTCYNRHDCLQWNWPMTSRQQRWRECIYGVFLYIAYRPCVIIFWHLENSVITAYKAVDKDIYINGAKKTFENLYNDTHTYILWIIPVNKVSIKLVVSINICLHIYVCTSMSVIANDNISSFFAL